MKTKLESRTIILAVLQALIGVYLMLFADMTEVGSGLVLKSIADISLRLDTKKEVI